jgi:hypothetical protein
MNPLTVNALPGQNAVDGPSTGTATAPADTNLFALLLGGYAAAAMPPATPAPAIGDSDNPASASLPLPEQAAT